MIEKDFIFDNCIKFHPELLEVKVESPSNIAIVKYWGKKVNQIPLNPSISFTLDKCKTISNITFSKKKSLLHNITLNFEGRENKMFEDKIKIFIMNIIKYCPYLSEYDIFIDTKNTFPHSSGIASSASGISAISIGIMFLESRIKNIDEKFFEMKSSFLSRIGSGSASRSIKGGVMLWGETKYLRESSNLYAVNVDFEINDIFKNFQDTILIIDKEEKKNSSSFGHSLMNNNPFSDNRVLQANDNIEVILEALKNGDLDKFGSTLEKEALTLHAMMMTSTPWVILLKPKTLKALEEVKDFREREKIPVYFTLDAGANVHILYPENVKNRVVEFIENSLKILCVGGSYINDCIGKGFKINQTIYNNG